MLTCISRSKKPCNDSSSPEKLKSDDVQDVKALSSQIKDMALKASGAYRHCTPCANLPQLRRNGSFGRGGESGSSSSSSAAADKFRRTWSFNSSSSAGKKELEARLKGISSGDGIPASASCRRVEPVVFVEENEPKEWVAQVEPGVLITFVSMPRGGNDLKRIRFSREMFNKWQAQRWWTDHCEKITELYNVQRLNRQAFPLRTTPDTNSSKASPVTPRLDRERLPVTLSRPVPTGMAYSSPDSLDQQSIQSGSNQDSSCGISSTPKLSSISGTAKTEASSSMRTSSSNQSGEISISNASDLESEWVEQDEPGVYITLRALTDRRRELKRVRFSRDKFEEMHAKLWWEENKARIHKQYL